jgi:hypothetical protein
MFKKTNIIDLCLAGSGAFWKILSRPIPMTCVTRCWLENQARIRYWNNTIKKKMNAVLSLLQLVDLFILFFFLFCAQYNVVCVIQ